MIDCVEEAAPELKPEPVEAGRRELMHFFDDFPMNCKQS